MSLKKCRLVTQSQASYFPPRRYTSRHVLLHGSWTDLCKLKGRKGKVSSKRLTFLFRFRWLNKPLWSMEIAFRRQKWEVKVISQTMQAFCPITKIRHHLCTLADKLPTYFRLLATWGLLLDNRVSSRREFSSDKPTKNKWATSTGKQDWIARKRHRTIICLTGLSLHRLLSRQTWSIPKTKAKLSRDKQVSLYLQNYSKFRRLNSKQLLIYSTSLKVSSNWSPICWHPTHWTNLELWLRLAKNWREKGEL